MLNPLRKVLSNPIFYMMCILAIMISKASMPAQAKNNLPDLGHAVAPALTQAEELELGRSVLNELQNTLRISNDSIVHDYLNATGYRIVATFSQPQANFQFFTVVDPHINAFALPGGFIGVNTGLILASESESELAGVLAHEVAHVTQRHIARMFEHMGKVKISTIAGLIASIVLATQNAEAGSGAMAATLAGGQQAMINFTREHEREADAIGIQALAQAGFDPMGMPSFFHRMYQDTRFYGRWIPEYLLTHPLSSERLMNAKSRAQEFPYKQIPDSLQFHLVKARLRVATAKTPQEATSYFKKTLENKNYRNRQGVLYGLALSYLQEAKSAHAKEPLDELLAQSPHEPLFMMLKAQYMMQENSPQAAINTLRKALQIHPRNYVLTTKLAEWMIEQEQTSDAINLIRKQIHIMPNRSELYVLLTYAYTKANRPVQAHIAQAQAHRLQGDLRSALRQLNMAKNLNAISDRERRQVEAQISELEQKS